MTKQWKPAVLAAALVLSAATGAAAAGAKGKAASIEGAWKVTNVVITGANPLTVTNPQESLYVFSHGHYANVSDQGDKARTASPPAKEAGKLTDAEKLARYEEWAPVAAQGGTYKVAGGKLTRTPTVAKSVAAVTGGSVESDIKITGDTMVLTSHAPAGRPARETKITFTRVE
jgi:hypothetical protein